MEYQITGYQPEKLFHFFEEISAIPRGSGNEKGISDYLVTFAKRRGLWVHQDEAWNVIIKKAGSPGAEDREPVMLQGHIDMVCEKLAGVEHDFTKEGLKLLVKDGVLTADGTTLGADNGVAVALMLMVLDDEEIIHPPVECVFTTEEETGLYGAEALDVSHLTGKRLINIDSEEEGIFTVSCAGGMESDCVLPVEYEEIGGCWYTVSVEGLQGGHSGSDIHKERGNSNILMGRLLCFLDESVNFRLGGLAGGLMDNAIPRSTKACLCVQEEDAEALEERLSYLEHVYREEFAASDPGVTIRVEREGKKSAQALTPKSAALLLLLLHMVPNGVIKNSMDMEGLVQTSLNLGILKLDEDAAHLIFSVRSSVESEKAELGSRLRHITEFLGGAYTQKGDYPGWAYRQDSPLRDTMSAVFERMYGKKPLVLAIHAGLECGFFSGKIEGLDCVSIGPDLYDVHTTRERLSISSTKRVYEFIVEVLKELKQA